MPLHDRETIRDQFDDCVFADRDLTRPVAKYRFPEQGTLPRDAFQLVSDELLLDGNSPPKPGDVLPDLGRAPGTSSSWIFAINTNLMDKDEYPQSAEIERRCVHMLADLWNAPDSANTIGGSALGYLRGVHVGGSGGEVALAGEAEGGRPADR